MGRGDPRRTAVRMEGVTVVRGGRRGRVVIDGLSLEVPAGVVVGLLGPSGSGKTTLMRAVVGVQSRVGGTVEVLGRPAGHPDLRRRVAYAAQTPSVYADLTVVENLRYFARVLGVGPADVDRCLDAVDLAGLARRPVAALSGGERARTSLAVALLCQPELLVLDEPTVGLDPVLRRDLWALFSELTRRGTSLLVSSHVMDEAERCDRLVLMRRGQVIADATLPDLLAATGAEDAEGAFLALVEGGPGGPARTARGCQDRTEGER